MIYPWSPFTFGTRRNETPAYGGSWKNLLLFRWHYRIPGLPPTPDNRFRDSFKWCDPINQKDGEAGEKCEISGAWFPGHMLRTIQDPESSFYGKKVGAPFYPREKAFRPAQNDTWGEPSE